MSLQADAQNLLVVLQRVLHALRRFGASYAAKLEDRLQPLVADFESGVRAHSRERASATLDDIKPLMRDISAAATKGEMGIFSDGTLRQYHELKMIFQESRYAGETL
jgi:hypothetical protein